MLSTYQIYRVRSLHQLSHNVVGRLQYDGIINFQVLIFQSIFSSVILLFVGKK